MPWTVLSADIIVSFGALSVTFMKHFDDSVDGEWRGNERKLKHFISAAFSKPWIVVSAQTSKSGRSRKQNITGELNSFFYFVCLLLNRKLRYFN